VAIQRFREQAGAGCFTNASRAREKVRVMQPLVRDCVAQRTRNRLLAGDFVKRLRTPLPGDYLIGHVERSCVLYRISTTSTGLSFGVSYFFNNFQRRTALPSESIRTTLNATSTSDVR
jgi:hypothetical protein